MKLTVWATPLLIAAALTPGFAKPNFPSGNDLLGTWEGRNKGYQGNLYTENESVRIIITEANGKAFKGYLKTNTAGKSSKRDIVNGFIAATGDIFATDDHGYYNMKLYENGSLGIVYRKSTPKELPSTLFGLYTKK